MITAANEEAIGKVAAGAWKPRTTRDSQRRSGQGRRGDHGPDDQGGGTGQTACAWIARHVKPSRRHLRNPTDYERKTCWKYSITCAREHATVETAEVRTAKAMGLHNLPSKTWQVNCGWVIRANITAGHAA